MMTDDNQRTLITAHYTCTVSCVNTQPCQVTYPRRIPADELYGLSHRIAGVLSAGLSTYFLCFYVFILWFSSVCCQGDDMPAQLKSVMEGGTVTIPCNLPNPDNVLIAWTSGATIYFINGDRWEAPSPRFSVVAHGNVYNLVLSGAQKVDNRQYTCRRQEVNTSQMFINLTVNGKWSVI